MRMRYFSILTSASLVASLSIHGSGLDPNHGSSRIAPDVVSLNTQGMVADPINGFKCGPGYGKCPEGRCCSTVGFCGTTAAHCRSPDCLVKYGRCDASKRPPGPPTTEVPRPHNGKVSYGNGVIRKCTVPGTVALTFDDGPDKYTCDLLDLLDRYDAKATFFITGVNNGKGAIDDPDHPWDKLIVRMRDSNHQIASHTWSHQDLSALSLDQLREQMLKNEAAFRNILGNFPSYMRPPYSRCGPENGCLEEMSSLGYHVILYDIDTADYNHDSPDQIQISKDIFDRHMASSKASENSWLVIAHDVHEQTVHNLTEHMLKSLRANGYRAVTVGECLDDPKDFWYRKDSHAPSDREYRNSTAIIKNISVDGSCGVTANATCTGSQFGHCCSARNFCGNSLDHCGVGCQSEAGRCPMDSTEPHDAGVIPSDDTIFEEPEDHGKKPTKSKSDAYSVSRVGSTVTGLMVVSAVMVLLV